MPPSITRGLTVAEIAARYRVSPDKVRAWIRRGELRGINTADRRCSRPRFVVTLDALEQFEKGREAVEPPKPARKRKKRPELVDYFPD